jgi:methionyl-tRNA formyltransferase
MSPFPGSWFLDGDTRIKVFSASLGDTVDATPGTILIDKEALQVVCGDRKSIFLNELQRPGKTKVKTAEFLRGYSFKNKIML